MYLVYEQYGLIPETAVALRLFHDLFYLFDTAGDRGKIYEFGLRHSGYDARKSSLAHSRRSPKDHRSYLIVLYKTAQDLALPEQMLLPDEFI